VEVGTQLQTAAVERVVAYGGLIWVVIAIGVGLWAAESKKRRFWLWVGLSLLTGPIAWYLLMRNGVAIPASIAIDCPKCGRRTRSDLRRCLTCKALIEEDRADRPAEIGRQAATVIFTARRLLSATRNAADAAANRPSPRRRVIRRPPTSESPPAP
jgi:hypothetical protein